MKIQLKNFKCYEDKAFDFGTDGLTLLNGKSGCGKSTIIQAIYFALFGGGRKLVTYGKKSCSVSLDFDGMQIVRTKTPNHLVVNNVYEDDAAQEIINNKFGDTFNVTGYIAQNAMNSFILMSSVDKLAFLEKFAFKDVNLAKLKLMTKNLIKERNETLIKTMTKLDMIECSINEFEVPEDVTFPLKCKKSQRNIKTDNETVKMNNCTVRIKKTHKTLIVLNNELRSTMLFTGALANHEQNKKDFTKELTQQQNLVEFVDDHLLQQYQEALSYILTHKELTGLSERISDDRSILEHLQNQEMQGLKNRLSTLRNGHWEEYQEDELIENIEAYKEMLQDSLRMSDMRCKLKDLEPCDINIETTELIVSEKKLNLETKKELLRKIKLQGVLLECPECDAKLCMKDGKLVAPGEVVKSEFNIQQLTLDIRELSSSISKLQEQIAIDRINTDRIIQVKARIEQIESRYEELLPVEETNFSLDYMQRYLRDHRRISNDILSIEKRIELKSWSASIIDLIEELALKNKRFGTLENDGDVPEHSDIAEETLRDNIKQMERVSGKNKSARSRIKTVEISIKNVEKRIDKDTNLFYKTNTVIRTIEVVENDIATKTKFIEEQELEHKKHDSNLKKIRLFQQYSEKMERYTELKTRAADMERQVVLDRKKYAGVTSLKAKILEAESIAIGNIVATINTHARIYLDCFFPDDPISVSLLPFKETKKAIKPQINIQVEYKSMEADLTMLSGGELSRVILAYTLALGEIFNTPLLLLDESTSSLDQEMSGVVFDGLRDHFNGKLVLIVAHQVVTGVFDNVIKL
jgi:exonuclease SbcC